MDDDNDDDYNDEKNAGWPNISGRKGRPPPTIILLRKLG